MDWDTKRVRVSSQDAIPRMQGKVRSVWIGIIDMEMEKQKIKILIWVLLRGKTNVTQSLNTYRK